MTIGLPRALAYHRYGVLWETFFKALGGRVVVSPESDPILIAKGESLADSECCLPVKAYLGHLDRLVGNCDYILAPRFERIGKNDEFCVRFWGLSDLARGTFPGVRILSYNLKSHRPDSEVSGFMKMGKTLGKSQIAVLAAYKKAKQAQLTADTRAGVNQRLLLDSPAIKVLVAAPPYILRDPAMGGTLLRLLAREGVTPIFPEACGRAGCRRASKATSQSLYWVMNKEAIGAIELLRPRVDGVILVSAFPCGTDSLVNELVLRREKRLPVIQIILDGQEGEAGLQTRVECFADILKERRRGYA
ncbi:MAG: acyl-CoA dehydratase activase-related protein [Oscillospiraceae bacterium]|nr:acyl-CoA dehydratase activase-related protein [Oscillospiraceae bacterium]